MRQKKLCENLILVFFILIILVLPLAGLFIKDSSSEENRLLTEFPEVTSPSELLTFPEDFSEYFSDHLFFKEKLVMLKSHLEASVFGEVDSSKVILGTRKPWLFNKSDDGQPLETYKRINLFTDEELYDIGENLSCLNSDLYDCGIDFVLLIAPDKEQVYGDKYMPGYIVRNDNEGRTRQLISYMKEAYPEVKIVYPLEALKDDSTGDTYYESDTHWNAAGAFKASEELFKELGYDKVKSCSFGKIPEKRGDLQKLVKLGASYDSTEYMITNDSGIYALTDDCITDDNDETVWESSTCEDGYDINIYLSGDSFRWNLGPFVKDNASKCTVTSRYYLNTDDLIEREPDVFVYEIAERYLHELDMLPGYNTMALQY